MLFILLMAYHPYILLDLICNFVSIFMRLIFFSSNIFGKFGIRVLLA